MTLKDAKIGQTVTVTKVLSREESWTWALQRV